MNEVISEYRKPKKAMVPWLGLAKLTYAHLKTVLTDIETVICSKHCHLNMNSNNLVTFTLSPENWLKLV